MVHRALKSEKLVYHDLKNDQIFCEIVFSNESCPNGPCPTVMGKQCSTSTFFRILEHLMYTIVKVSKYYSSSTLYISTHV